MDLMVNMKWVSAGGMDETLQAKYKFVYTRLCVCMCTARENEKESVKGGEGEK